MSNDTAATATPVELARQGTGSICPVTTYTLWFVGNTFYVNNDLSPDGKNIQTNIANALADPGSYDVFSQYYQTSSTSGTFARLTLDTVWGGNIDSLAPQTNYTRDDLIAQASTAVNGAISAEHDNGLSAVWPSSRILVMILPPDSTLSDGDMTPNRPAASLQGLAGVHGNFTFNAAVDAQVNPLGVVYFCAVVWSDVISTEPNTGKTNGVVVPGWKGWQNTCAALYKELAQVLTDPDVDRLPDTNSPATTFNGYATWGQGTSGKDQWLEIGNIPGVWAKNAGTPWAIYGTVTPASGNSYPIQVLWSNTTPSPVTPDRVGTLTPPCPYFPTGFVPA